MDEFDMSNLDSFDFEAAEKSAKENSDKKADLNVLAARFYRRLGYQSKANFDFSVSQHPQEQMMWAMAVEAYYMHISSGIFD